MSVVPETITPHGQRARFLTATMRLYMLAGFIAGLLLVTAVPYAYGYISAPQGRVFQGIAFNVADIVQYWSWMRDHRVALLVPNRMTPEPNEPALFNSLWLALGRIQIATGWGNAAIYQLLRLTGGTAFLISLWWFVGLFTREPRQRWTAYLLASVGGGLGWIWVVDKYINRLDDVRYPLDLYVVEPNGFFALMALPHLLVAAAMILLVFGCFLAAEQRDDWRLYGLATFAALMLGLSHAYDLIMVYSVLGVHVLVQFVQARRVLWRRFWGLAAVGLLSFPPAGYFAYLTSQNPLWKEVLAQFDNAGVFTPDLLHIPILLGLPFILTGLYGLSLLAGGRRQTSPRVLQSDATTGTNDGTFSTPGSGFLWVWTIVGFGLLYIPTDYQIKMLNPYQVPLALLAAEALWRWAGTRRQASNQQLLVHRRQSSIRVSLVVLFIIATLPANLYLWGWRIIDLRRAQAPFYLSQGQVAALEWLDAHSDTPAVVFSGLEIGQYIPALTGHRSFLGHWA